VGDHGGMADPVSHHASGVEVSDNKTARQYEARVDGELAGYTTYSVHDDRVAFTHAEVLPQWRGRGVASALVRDALDDTIAQGKLITPLCPFVVGFVRRNEAYQQHVDAAHRTRLGFAAGDGPGNNGDEGAGRVPTDD
jgi:uncharacterized protein